MVWGMIMPKWKVFLRTRFLPWIFVLYLVFFTRASIFSSVFFATRPRPCKTLSTVPIDTCVFRAMSLIVIMVYSRDSGKVNLLGCNNGALTFTLQYNITKKY